MKKNTLKKLSALIAFQVFCSLSAQAKVVSLDCESKNLTAPSASTNAPAKLVISEHETEEGIDVELSTDSNRVSYTAVLEQEPDKREKAGSYLIGREISSGPVGFKIDSSVMSSPVGTEIGGVYSSVKTHEFMNCRISEVMNIK
ncbi:MAG: hypothetical protein ACXVCY_02835 [Pseudobdellovibrionaceae bacterium]